MNIPQLRFPEFNEDWEKHNLGEIATFSKGKGISKADIVEDGTTECIRYGELYTTYGETIDVVKSKTNINAANLVFSEANDVIIPASGETQIDIATASCVLRNGIAMGGDLNIIKTQNNGVFLSYYLNNKKKQEIASLAQGIAVVHLYSSQLSLLKLNLPSRTEQDKIALFIRSTDEKIQALKKKHSLLEQYKKGIMQKLFSQEGETVPKLRFSDFKNSGEWEIKKIADCGEIINGLTGKSGEDFGTGKAYVTYKQVFDDSIIDFEKCGKVYISENENQNTLQKGDILFTTSSETPNEVGFASVLLDSPKEETYLNSFCFALRPFSLKETQSEFLHYLFHSPIYRKAITPLAQGITRYNISKRAFLNLELPIPDPKEQNKIAGFLSTIDKKISHTKKQLEKLEMWKKGLLQKMFC